MQKVFGIWYLKYQIPSPQKVFGKVFKCPQIIMYLVFYLNTSFWVFDPTLALRHISLGAASCDYVVVRCLKSDNVIFGHTNRFSYLLIYLL